MEKEKNNEKKVLIGVLVAVILVLASLCIFLLFVRQSLIDDAIKKDECNCQNVANEHSINYKDVLKDFKNYDGSYGTMKSYQLSDNGTASLSIDGKVRISNSFKNVEEFTLSNISNAVDIFYSDGLAYQFDVYILLENGDLYVYHYIDSDGNYYSSKNAEKVNGIKDAVKIVEITYGPKPGSGAAHNLGVIDKNNQFISISSFKN